MVGAGATFEIATVMSYTAGTNSRRFCTADTKPYTQSQHLVTDPVKGLTSDSIANLIKLLVNTLNKTIPPTRLRFFPQVQSSSRSCHYLCRPTDRLKVCLHYKGGCGCDCNWPPRSTTTMVLIYSYTCKSLRLWLMVGPVFQVATYHWFRSWT